MGGKSMDAFDCIATKLDVRAFASRQVPSEIRKKILEAARSTGTGLNTQHWRFIVVSERLDTLAKDSTSGAWVSGADFAIIVLTNPKYKFHLIDAGRVVQNMQLAAWNFGVASGVFTGIDEPKFRTDFGIPDYMNVSMTVGFGYPEKLLLGRKSRNKLEDLIYYERFGSKT
jgi:nitroreductase